MFAGKSVVESLELRLVQLVHKYNRVVAFTSKLGAFVEGDFGLNGLVVAVGVEHHPVERDSDDENNPGTFEELSDRNDSEHQAGK